MIDDPGIGSSFPELALKPPMFPEKFSTKNHSFAADGGGFELPLLPHATRLNVVKTEARSVTCNLARPRYHPC